MEAGRGDWNWVQKGPSLTTALPLLPQDCPPAQGSQGRLPALLRTQSLPWPAEEFRLQGHQRDITQAPPLPKHTLAVSEPGTAARARPCLSEPSPVGERPCPLDLPRAQAQLCLPTEVSSPYPTLIGTPRPSLLVQYRGDLTLPQRCW